MNEKEIYLNIYNTALYAKSRLNLSMVEYTNK